MLGQRVPETPTLRKSGVLQRGVGASARFSRRVDGIDATAHREKHGFVKLYGVLEGIMKHDPDILISRVVDGVATPADWAGLEQQALQSPGLWKEVALAQRQHLMLQEQVALASSKAEQIELPASIAHVPQFPTQISDPTGVRTRFARVATWGGWAAAATLAFAFVSQAPKNLARTVPDQKAGVLDLEQLRGVLSSEDARNLYLDAGQREGTVLEEVPTKILVNVSASPDGEGGEVTYLRQFIERTKVKDLYKYSLDELGNKTMVRMPIGQRIRPAM